MSIRAKSKQQLDEEQVFNLLVEDDYRLQIVKQEPKIQDKYNAKPGEDGKVPQEEVINIQLEVVSFKDGEKAQDEKGEDATGRKVFFTARPESMGFQQDGTPAKTRCLIAFATGQDVNGEIELNAWEDLIGKQIDAQIIQKQNTKGKMKNVIARFLAPSKRKGTKKDKPEPDIIEEEEEKKPKGKEGMAQVKKLGRNYKTGGFNKIANKAAKEYGSKQAGEKVEREFLKILRRIDPDAVKLVGNVKEADLFSPKLKRHFEIKYDIRSDDTQNLAFEYRFRGKPSGLAATKAEIWVQADTLFFHCFRTEDLKSFLRDNWQYFKKVYGGDSNDALMVLCPERIIKSKMFCLPVSRENPQTNLFEQFLL